MLVLRQLTFAAITLAVPCFAQTGTVMFYSISLSTLKQVKVATTPIGTVPFTGWLFDGSQRLAHASAGRFMTFHLAAGQHSFTVPYSSCGPGKTALLLQIESGGHYCVRLSASDVNPIVVPIAYVDSKIEQVPCGQASQEAKKYKRIDVKRVDVTARNMLDASPTFPEAN